MSPAPDLTDPQLTELVVRTLADKARDASVPTEPFDPTRRTSFSDLDTGGPDLLAPARPTRRRVRWMAPLAAAAVAIVVVAVGVVVTGGDDHRPATRTERNPVAEQPTNTPDGALLPGWLPEGLVPWGGGWRRPAPMIPDGTLQLFRGDGDASLVIEFQPPNVTYGGGDPITVRGVEGGVSGRTEEEPTSFPAFLHWMEDGNSVNVEYSSMRLDDVVAFLNGLTWRSSNHQEGFEPPTGGSLRLVHEVGPPTRQAVLAEFMFGDPDDPPRSRDEGRYLSISTSSSVGRADNTYYLNWLMSGDGEIPEEVADDPDVKISADTAMVSWADGRSIYIRSRGVSEDDLRRVVDSVAAGTGQDIDRLVAAEGERLAALPLVAQAALPSGTVELRDGGGFDRAACLHLPGRAPACGWLGFEPDVLAGADTAVVDASVLIEGTWYALAAGEVPVALTSEDPLNPTTLQLANETGTDGPYYFVLALPPPEMQHVALYRDGGLSYYLTRPESEHPFPDV